MWVVNRENSPDTLDVHWGRLTAAGSHW